MYNVYLNDVQNTSLDNAYSEMEFWKQKLDKQPNQFPYLAKLAASYNSLFSITGNIEYLKEAENKYVEFWHCFVCQQIYEKTKNINFE